MVLTSWCKTGLPGHSRSLLKALIQEGVCLSGSLVILGSVIASAIAKRQEQLCIDLGDTALMSAPEAMAERDSVVR